MAASMAIAALCNRAVFGNTRLLAQPGEGVKFTKNGNDRPLVTSFTHDSGRHATDIFGDPEPFGLERGDMFLHRAELIIQRFRGVKDAIRQLNECLFLRVNQFPDILFVLYHHLSPKYYQSSEAELFADYISR